MSLGALRALLFVLGAVLWIGCGDADDPPSPSPSLAASDASPSNPEAPRSDAGALPTIASFSAAKSTLTKGASTMLVAVFEGGSAFVDGGIGAVASGVGYSTGPLFATTQFTLTVTAGDGSTATRFLTVEVVDAPTIDSFTAAKSRVTVGDATTVTAIFAGGTGSVDEGIGGVTSGIAVATASLATNMLYTLTVTNAAGDAVTKSLSVDVVDAPMITSFTAASSPIAAGQATHLTATFTGGTGSLNHGLGAITSGAAVSTNELSTDRTFTLTVTNAVGDSVTRDLTVNVVVGPWIKSFTAASTRVSRYKNTTLTPVFYGGAGSIDQGVGAVLSGSAATTGTVLGRTTFTLTVTDGAGNSTSKSVDVDVKKEVFVAEGMANSVRVFDEDGKEEGTSVLNYKRRIAGAQTQLEWPSSVFVAGDELFVANRTRILVFDVAGEGNIAPKRTIGPWDAGFSHFAAIAIADGEVFVSATSTRIDVFNIDDVGTASPKRTIQGPSTLIGGVVGVAVDGNELYVANRQHVAVHSAAATGDVAPLRTYPAQNSNYPYGIAVNGSELIIGGTKSIETVNKMTFAPIRQVDFDADFPSAWSCAVVESEVACSNTASMHVKIGFWPLTANGLVPPTRVFTTAGSLQSPLGICAR